MEQSTTPRAGTALRFLKSNHPDFVNLALAISRRVASRAIHRFGSFQDHGRDDLTQVGYLACVKVWDAGRYDPAKSAVSSYLYRAAWCDIQDLHRQLTRKRRHEFGGQSKDLNDADEPSDQAGDNAALRFTGGETLSTWLRECYARLRGLHIVNRIKSKPRRGGQYSRTPTQRAMLALLVDRMPKLSCRGLVALLMAEPELLAIMGMASPPSYKYFHRLRKSVTRIEKTRHRLKVPRRRRGSRDPAHRE